MKEAEKFSEELFNSESNNPKVIGWYGRVLLYCGKETQGKKDAVKAIKAIKIAATKKD
jgi:hypothetical protein